MTEVPLLYEVGSEAQFDKVVVDHRAGRAAPRALGGGGRRRASSACSPDDEKVARADFAYVNDGSLDELDAFVAGVMEELAP